MATIEDKNYDHGKTLSFSSVRWFAQNPARALDAYNKKWDWFDSNKALLFGQLLHTGLADFLTDSKGSLEKFIEETPEMFTKAGKLRSDFETAQTCLDVMRESDILQFIHANMNSDDWKGFSELGFTGTLDGITYQGKPDVFLINEKTKEIRAFDFKTSAYYDPSGRDWGSLITGEREYGSVIWHDDKMFPMQAGAYRELLWQNGYADYKVTYQYLVITKEKTPRFDIWTLDNNTMDTGLSMFKRYLRQANEYVTGNQIAPVVADHSSWFNARTQKAGNQLSVHITSGIAEKESDTEPVEKEVSSQNILQKF